MSYDTIKSRNARAARAWVESERIVLIGCGKEKISHATVAGNLYTGPLFSARREHAERTGRRWFIVSALYGVLDPARVIDPYDVKFPTDSQGVTEWVNGFRSAFFRVVCDTPYVRPIVLEVHAGEPYVNGIRKALAQYDWIKIDHPVEGLGIGEQIRFYKNGGRL